MNTRKQLLATVNAYLIQAEQRNFDMLSMLMAADGYDPLEAGYIQSYQNTCKARRTVVAWDRNRIMLGRMM